MRGHCLIWNEWVPQWIRSMSSAETADVLRLLYRGSRRLVMRASCIPGMSSTSRSGPGTRRPADTGSARGTTRSAPAMCAVPSSAWRWSTRRPNWFSTKRRPSATTRSGSRCAAGLLQLVDELKHAGVPLHAVGLQGHLQPRYPHDPARFRRFPSRARRAKRRYLHHRIRRARRHVPG